MIISHRRLRARAVDPRDSVPMTQLQGRGCGSWGRSYLFLQQAKLSDRVSQRACLALGGTQKMPSPGGGKVKSFPFTVPEERALQNRTKEFCERRK